MKRDLLSIQDLSPDEVLDLLDLAQKIKTLKGTRLDLLNGKSIGLIFQKPSNRTRVSFEVAIWELGGNCIYLGPHEIELGKRESVADAAQTLSRYLSGIVARTYSHADILELGETASIPVINGLSDLYHPCQALADIFSIKESFSNLENLKLAYVGDGNNVCHSLLLACAMVGIHVHVATPPGYQPKDDIVATAKTLGAAQNATLCVSNSPKEAVKDAQIIYADVWTSMGQEQEAHKRLKTFMDYQINSSLVKEADKNYIFMHCLPAHRGEEVTEEIIDGPHSIIFDQAGNRLHMQKAILQFLLGPKKNKQE